MVLAMLECQRRQRTACLHSLPERFFAPSKQAMAAEMIEVLLIGLHPR
jgi:hypothetical protein